MRLRDPWFFDNSRMGIFRKGGSKALWEDVEVGFHRESF